MLEFRYATLTGDTIFYLGAIALPVVAAFATVRFFKRTSDGGGRRVVRLLVGNALILLTLGSAVLLGFETYYRYGYDSTDSARHLKITQAWFDRHWRENASGFRDDIDYRNRPAEGRHRVTFVGDSFAAGHGIADVNARFANLLRAERDDLEVHVLADPGDHTLDSIEMLEALKTSGYEFQTVVLVYCFNDIQPFLRGVERFYRAEKQRPSAIVQWFTDHSFALNTLYYRIRRALRTREPRGESYASRVQSGYAGDAWLEQAQALTRLRDVVRSAGGELRVVTFPWLLRLAQGKPGEFGMHAKLDRLWKRLGVPHLDLLDIFEKQPGQDLVVSRWDPHPSVLAHRLAADAINAWLVPGTVSPRLRPR